MEFKYMCLTPLRLRSATTAPAPAWSWEYWSKGTFVDHPTLHPRNGHHRWDQHSPFCNLLHLIIQSRWPALSPGCAPWRSILGWLLTSRWLPCHPPGPTEQFNYSYKNQGTSLFLRIRLSLYLPIWASFCRSSFYTDSWNPSQQNKHFCYLDTDGWTCKIEQVTEKIIIKNKHRYQK